jgi:CDP-diacylglycerol--glycerol-3-phosphate 3-phosphatidyltransferase
MTIYDLKPAFQNLLRPICRKLAGLGVSANQVTVLAMLLSIGVGLNFAAFPDTRWAALLLPIWLFIRMALNAIDGMLAREHNMQSPLGGVLNELSDVISDAALYLPFALVAGISPTLVVIAVALAIVSEMAGVVAVQIGANRRYDSPMGKSDRAFAFGLLGLLLGLGVDLRWWDDAAVALVAALTLITIVNRSSKALQELAKRDARQPH